MRYDTHLRWFLNRRIPRKNHKIPHSTPQLRRLPQKLLKILKKFLLLEFKIKTYLDSHPEPDGNGFLVLNSKKPISKIIDPNEYRQTTKPARPKLQPEPPAPKPWVNAVNSFSVLGETDKNGEIEKNEFEEEEKDVPILPVVVPETVPKPEPVPERQNWWEDSD